MHRDPQPDQPQRQLGGEVARRAPGRAVVHPEPSRPAPRAKARRSCSRTAAAGTRPQVPRGENRVQSTAPLHSSVKRSQLASSGPGCGYFPSRPSATSRGARPRGPCRPPAAARGGRCQAGAGGPALERPLRGDGPPGRPGAMEADQAGSPGRMLAAQSQGRPLISGERASSAGATISGAIASGPGGETPRRADGPSTGQSQRRGDLAGSLALFPEPEDGLTDRDGEGTWHG